MDLQPLGRISDFDGFILPEGRQHALTWRGFASSRAEDVFRKNQLERDRLYGLLFVVANLLLLSLGLVLNGLSYHATLSWYLEVGFRSFALFVGGCTLLRFSRPVTPQQLDRLIAVLAVGFILATVASVQAPHADPVEAVSSLLTLLLLLYFVAPMPWYLRGSGGLCATMAYVVHIAWFQAATPPLVLLVGIGLANTLGLALAYETSRWRRLRFNALANEVQRRVELENLLANSRQLDEILPICAHCRKIRNAKGTWLMMDRYFRERGVKFSHGICAECLLVHHPEQFETR